MGLPIRQNHLREVIQAKLLTKCDAVAYKRAKQSTGTHVVFMIDSFGSEELLHPVTLDVRISGAGQDSSEIEDLTDSIWDMFDHMYHLDDELEFTSYQNTRSDMDEPDAGVISRRLLIELRVL